MSWLITKGDDLLVSKAKHVSTLMNFMSWPSESRRATWELLACDADKAPQCSKDSVCTPLFVNGRKLIHS
jgi:hypothetical protein